MMPCIAYCILDDIVIFLLQYKKVNALIDIATKVRRSSDRVRRSSDKGAA